MQVTLSREVAHAARQPAPLALAINDARFVDLLTAYRSSGGLATGHEIAARRPLTGLPELARAIAAREVIAMEWGGHRWLPFFQFERGELSVREPVRLLINELAPVLDDAGLVQWFVDPNPGLDNRRPVRALDDDYACVHDAARALRFACCN